MKVIVSSISGSPRETLLLRLIVMEPIKERILAETLRNENRS
jgi:hypothetical protein